MSRLSVVSPVYRSEGSLRELHRRLSDVLQALQVPYEIILVNDGSPDRSGEVLSALVELDAHVIVLTLSRNFGQHPAILAGLEHARGDQVVVMDCDLQEAPEDLPRLIAKAAEGYDVVFARRRQSQRGWFKRVSSKIWFRLINALSELPVEPDIGTLSLVSRQVVNELLRMPNRHSHYQHLVRWMGFRQAFIDIEHSERFDGAKSSYSVRALIRHAFRGIVAHSTRLLTLSIYAGFAFVVLSVLQFGSVIYLKVFRGVGVEGWTSLIAAIWLIGGSILSSLGVIGLYLARIVEEVKERPSHIVRERLGKSLLADADEHSRRNRLADCSAQGGVEPDSARSDDRITMR